MGRRKSSALSIAVENGDFDLRQNEAKALSSALRNTARVSDDCLAIVSRRKLAVAEKWWTEKNAAEMLQSFLHHWDNETALTGDAAAAWGVDADWQQRFEANAAAEAEAEAGETDDDSAAEQVNGITPVSEPGDTEEGFLDFADDSWGNVEAQQEGEDERDEPFTPAVGDSYYW
ncbi:hypothetical protein EJ07DRAFT_154375 [Lizonia empirigonia]|nr:hypothetical protein EJ07DRAFT_154375 [Lizonia empirigonia]